MKVKTKLFYWYAAFVIIYACLTLLPAPATTTLQRYNITAAELRALEASFILLAAIIWLATFYGYYKLRAYTHLIKTNRDGRQVNKLAHGLLILAVGSPLNSIIDQGLSLIAQHHSAFTTAAAVITNYTSVFVPLAAFIYIGLGARGLSSLSKLRPHFPSIHLAVLAVIVLGVGFCYLIARAHSDIRLTYHMSYGLVMLTLAVPYMYTWFLGLFAVAEMQIYSQRLNGIVYRQGWSRLAFGLGAIILLSILIQYLTTLSTWLVGLSLSWILLLLYALLLLLAAAYILVALGAKRLMKIEEV